MQALVSVIMPLYNIEVGLKNSIKSVLEQTYKNLEVILVDDGSTDDTLSICRQFEVSDSRVRVIHKDNGGVSSARNVGIDYADGDYIVFIDGDDIVAPFYVERLIKMCDACVLSICMHERITDYDYTFADGSNSFINLRAKECAKRVLTGSFPISACASIYVRERIGSLRFPVGIRNNEDKLFLYQYLLRNEKEKVSITNDKMYGYYVREGSATTRSWNGSKDVILVADKMYELTQQMYPGWEMLARTNRISARLSTLKAIIRSNIHTPSTKKVFKEIKEETLSIILPKDAGTTIQIEYTALKIADPVYILLVNIYYTLTSENRRYKRNERVITQKA